MTTSGEQVFAVDLVSIDVNNLTFAYGTAPPILNDIHVSFDQGKLYSLAGGRRWTARMHREGHLRRRGARGRLPRARGRCTRTGTAT